VHSGNHYLINAAESDWLRPTGLSAFDIGDDIGDKHGIPEAKPINGIHFQCIFSEFRDNRADQPYFQRVHDPYFNRPLARSTCRCRAETGAKAVRRRNI
jgi:hypothetical protein